MKKITLFFGLSLVSLIGWAQQDTETTKISESIEREVEYIIVLDDVKVEDNIELLLSGDQIEREMNSGFSSHELAHEEPYDHSLEAKFIDGSFSYNAYALNYSEVQDPDKSLG